MYKYRNAAEIRVLGGQESGTKMVTNYLFSFFKGVQQLVNHCSNVFAAIWIGSQMWSEKPGESPHHTLFYYLAKHQSH